MKDSMVTIKDLFELQKRFNDIFYNMNDLKSGEREEITKSLTLALHTEVSSLISAINFKDCSSLSSVIIHPPLQVYNMLT